MLSWPLIQYVLTAALRDRLVVTLLLMIVLGSSLSMFLGSAAVIEQQSFSVVMGAGGLRFLGVFGVILFVCFYIRRAFDSKEVEFLLSRPISRMGFLINHTLSFIILALLIALVVTTTVSLIGKPEFSGLVLWGSSIAVEYAIMATAALFFSMVLSSAAGAALACLGLYVLARMVGVLLGIADVPTSSYVMTILAHVMEFISIVIPRLDLMGQTSWLVYGTENLIGFDFMNANHDLSKNFISFLGLYGFIFIQGIFSIALLLAATSYDFFRRQF